MYNKYIISETGTLRFGRVYLHRDLLEVGEDTCYGGGLWKIDYTRQAVLLYGRSFDFGGPDFSRISEVDWSMLGGKPLPIFFLPHWPSEDQLELVR